MALQVLPSPPPVTGYAQLGNVIANAGERYAQTARQDQLMAQARAQQLADVESNRAASRAEGDRIYERARGAQLSDVESSRAREDQLRDVARGFQLEDREEGRLWAEGAQIREEMRKLAAMKPDRDNAQQMANAYAEQLNRVVAREEEISRVLTSKPAQFSPNDPAVQNLAQQLAGGSQKREDIAREVPKALEQLNGEAIYRHSVQMRAAQDVLVGIKATQQQASALLQQLMQTFRVAPTVAPPTGGAVSGPGALGGEPAPAPMRTIGASGLAGALDRALGVTTPQAPAAAGASAPAMPAGGALLDNPTANPVIERGNAALQQQARLQRQNDLNAAIREREVIAQQLAQAASTVSSAPVGAMGGMVPYRIPDPIVNAQQTADLLKQQAAADAKVKQLQMQEMGPAAGGVTLPAANTLTFSTPATSFAPKTSQWWQQAPVQ